MASNTKGMSEILSKVRVPKRTKEASQMNEAYEPTQTAVQYWTKVSEELAKRKAAYEKAIEEFKSKGGTAQGVEDDIVLHLGDTEVRVLMNSEGRVLAIDTHLSIDAGENELTSVANAITAIIGLSKNEAAQEMIKELRSYVENDGYLVGMNALVNKTVLNNPILTALTMVPDEVRSKASTEE